MRFLIYAFLLCVCGCSLSRPAVRPIFPKDNFSLLVVYTEALDQNSAEAATRYALRGMREQLGMTLTASFQKVTGTVDATGPVQRISKWGRKIKPTLTRDYDMIVVLLPADPILLRSVTQVVQGYAEAVGVVGQRRNNFAYVHVSSDAVGSGRLIMHELAHLMGADHTVSGLMVFDTTFIHLSTGFSESSIAQIQTALARNLAKPTVRVTTTSKTFRSAQAALNRIPAQKTAQLVSGNPQKMPIGSNPILSNE